MVQAIRTGTDSIRVLWKPVAMDSSVGPIKGYKIYYRPAGSTLWTIATACSSCISIDLEKLANFTTYRFQVAAFSELGDGARSPTFGVLEGI